jgi:hypothetical protein
MPLRDKMGPIGAGPRTGKGLGTCGQTPVGGLGMGRGYGRAMCGWFYRKYREMTKKEKENILRNEIEDLKQETRMVEDELKNLQEQ